jgi:hypothetical protein
MGVWWPACRVEEAAAAELAAEDLDMAHEVADVADLLR